MCSADLVPHYDRRERFLDTMPKRSLLDNCAAAKPTRQPEMVATGESKLNRWTSVGTALAATGHMTVALMSWFSVSFVCCLAFVAAAARPVPTFDERPAGEAGASEG